MALPPPPCLSVAALVGPVAPPPSDTTLETLQWRSNVLRALLHVDYGMPNARGQLTLGLMALDASLPYLLAARVLK